LFTNLSSNQTYFSRLASIVFLMMLANTFTALAQPNSKQYHLDEMVVTGQFEENSLSKSVYKVKLIDAKQIKQQGAFNLQQVLSKELNIRIFQDPLLGSNLQLQGVGGNNIKILVDGVPIIGREAGNIDLSQINLNNVERIEMVEGPMSVNFGSDALGGVINIISKKNLIKGQTHALNTYYESIGQYNLDLNSNFGLKNNKSIQVYAGRNFFEGYAVNPEDRLKLWKPRTQYNTGFNFTKKFKEGSLKLNNFVFYEKLSNRGLAEVDWTKASAQDQYYFTKRLSSTLLYERSLQNNSNLNMVIGMNYYARTMETYLKDLVSLQETLIPSQETQQTSELNNLMSRGTYAKKYKKHLGFQLGYECNLDWAYGSKFNGTQFLGEYSVFGSIEYHVNEKLVFRPGMRTGINTQFGMPLIPSLHMKYDFSDAVSLRANIAKGYRAPGMKELYLQFADINHNIQGNLNLKPEQSLNAQVLLSIQKNESKNTIKLEPSVFINHIENMIGLAKSGNANNVSFMYINLNQFDNMGFNLNTDFTSSDFKIGLGYAYIGNRSIFNQQNNAAYYFNNEIKLQSSYLFKKPGISLNLYAKYNGKFQTYIYQADKAESSIGFVDPFTIIDITASKTFFKDKLSLTCGFKNLLNYTNVNANMQNGPHQSGSNSAMMGMGRSVFCNLKYTFDN